ncbi:MAG: hypothetical protein WBG18_22190 [Xanthobacteraceae bacterium]
MRRAALALCLLVTPAFGEAQLDYAIGQYTQGIRRAYLAEAAGQQFIADRNVTTAAERALFACQTDERALVSVLDMVFDQTDWGPMVASRIRLRLKSDLERWFTDLNAKAEQNISTPRTPSSVDSRWPSVPMPAAK